MTSQQTGQEGDYIATNGTRSESEETTVNLSSDFAGILSPRKKKKRERAKWRKITL
jgi:hypothetical protein